MPGSPVADFDAFSGDSNVDTGSNGGDWFKKPRNPLTDQIHHSNDRDCPPNNRNFLDKTTFLLCFDLLPVPVRAGIWILDLWDFYSLLPPQIRIQYTVFTCKKGTGSAHDKKASREIRVR